MPTSAGTKVTPGQNAPTKQEGPGAVASDSLASESQAFRNANEVSEQQSGGQPQESSSARAPGSSTNYSSSSSKPSESSAAGTAPSYVENQYARDTAGPHGKNITEDNNMTEDASKNASFTAEIGSDADPSRLAEQKMNLRNSSVAGSNGGGRETGIDGKTPYDALGSEKEA